MARGIMCVMMSGEAAGRQADRAGRVALGLGTGGGQSIPAAVAAYLNATFYGSGRSLASLVLGASYYKVLIYDYFSLDSRGTQL